MGNCVYREEKIPNDSKKKFEPERSVQTHRKTDHHIVWEVPYGHHGYIYKRKRRDTQPKFVTKKDIELAQTSPGPDKPPKAKIHDMRTSTSLS